MKNLTISGILTLVLLTTIEVAASKPTEIENALRSVRPDLPAIKVTESDVPGIYEATVEGGFSVYVTKDGKYFFSGDLYEISNNAFINIKEAKLKPARKMAMNSVNEKELLIFSPKKSEVKATISVFTDIDCGYCRKLHQEVPELNRLGIAVRYLAYPRNGINSPAYIKTVSAWCSKNPKQALTKAKAGEAIPVKSCANPVAKHYNLGNEIGVSGTPAIVYEDGTLQPGYAPAHELAKRLGVL